MRRGDVYAARLDPVEGSEQAGTRPVVIVSRDAINQASTALIAVPFTTYRPQRRLYPSQALVRASDGGLTVDSVAMAEQVRVLSKRRLGRHLGMLSPHGLAAVDRALLIALDLPVPT